MMNTLPLPPRCRSSVAIFSETVIVGVDDTSCFSHPNPNFKNLSFNNLSIVFRIKGIAPLREPDGRLYFAGDYMTDMSSWMQGAFESAREVATALHRRALARG